MSFSILPTPPFERELKKLSKKYPSLKSDFLELLSSLIQNPDSGKSLGNNCYKIRMAISSKNKGKSSGARVITYVQIIDEQIYLLSIYDKSDVSTITDKELIARINGL